MTVRPAAVLATAPRLSERRVTIEQLGRPSALREEIDPAETEAG